jgi:hypothetical protein
MAAQKINIMQISENYIIFFLGVTVAFVGYLLARAMGTFDKRLDKHEAQIAEHDKLISDVHSLQKSNEIQLQNINNNLENIFLKINDYDNNIKHFYEKYDLPIKK